MKRVIRYMFLTLLILAAVLGVALFTPLGDRPLAALLPVGKVAPVDFATLTPMDNPNRFLICPSDFAEAGTALVGEFRDFEGELTGMLGELTIEQGEAPATPSP